MIQYISVSKSYNGFLAIEDITFGVDDGEFVLITGHSGSGKTTLIKMLIREILPSKGQVLIEGDDISNIRYRDVAKLRRKIGVVFQDFKLLEDKNVYENVAFALEASGRKDKEIKEIVPYVLEIVGLEDKARSFPKELSGGQKQKVTIARAIANDPKILVADEPTGNLDDEATWEIVEILQNINKWGATVIMATHGKQIIDRLRERTIILEKGRLVEDSKNSTRQVNVHFEEKLLNTLKVNKPTEKKSEHIPEKKKSPPLQSKDTKTQSKHKLDEKTQPKIRTQGEILKQKAQTQPSKEKPRLKIGLSSKNPHKNLQREQSVQMTGQVEELRLESLGLTDSTLQLLRSNNYLNFQDVIDAGSENLKNLPGAEEEQIEIILKAIEKQAQELNA